MIMQKMQNLVKSAWPGSHDLLNLKCWDPFNIYKTTEAANVIFNFQLAHNECYAKNAKLGQKGGVIWVASPTFIPPDFVKRIKRSNISVMWKMYGSADNCSQYWLENFAHPYPNFYTDLNKCKWASGFDTEQNVSDT